MFRKVFLLMFLFCTSYAKEVYDTEFIFGDVRVRQTGESIDNYIERCKQLVESRGKSTISGEGALYLDYTKDKCIFNDRINDLYREIAKLELYCTILVFLMVILPLFAIYLERKK